MNMITIIVIIKVKEGNMDKAIEIIKKVVPKIREDEPGLVNYIPYKIKGAKNKNTIIFYEQYKDKIALTEHMTKLPENLKELFPLLDGSLETKNCIKII
ncbi:MAG: hypothetical protein GF329_06815 [Candidatus Lokiarchaeota archaeon]|nr:hypothetical protein [Candidatus Lokiarchaeota archaeon]